MSYPGPKVHRVSRRKLGRSQFPAASGVTCTVTTTGTTNVTLTFSRPVVVTGTIPITVATVATVSQTVVSPTVVTQVMSGNVATHAYTLPPNPTNVMTYQGGMVAGSTGTF